MKIIVNKEEKEFNSVSTIQDLIKALGFEQKTGIAFAINMRIVAKADWALHPIEENDNITIITASQGG